LRLDPRKSEFLGKEYRMNKIAKATAMIVAAAFALSIAACSPPAAKSDFAGTWKVTDTSGAPFEIVLADDGTASADRSGEKLEGTWKEENDAALITWKEGWTTKIAKVGDGYSKMAWDKGVTMDSPPTNTSSAEKVK
jgi:hypothetical protein